MKNKIKNFGLLFVGLLTAGVITSADAQRGYYGRGSNRGDYNRGNNRVNYPGNYRGGYSKSYSNNYSRSYGSVYSYRPPVVIHGGYSPYFGPRYYGVPHGSISITFGGNPYYYYGGSYYRPYGAYYRTVFPPIGLRIGILPVGYMPIYVGPDPYYFYNGTYYRRYDDRNYEVVDAPMGAQISSLPTGAKSVVVNGEKFYELNGTYYKEDRDSKGRRVFTVVGKNGEIDNTEEAPDESSPRMGDRVAELPENTKTITLNGQKLYVAPDETYYKLESDGSYTIVGLAGSDINTNTSANSF